MSASTFDRRRILVLANETVADELVERVVEAAAGDAGADVLLVASARDMRPAEERLVVSLAALRARGLDAEGYVGDSDPLVAAKEALRLFPADDVVILAA